VSSDADPRALEFMVEGYRHMSLAEKLGRVEQLNEAVLTLAAARIQKENPGISEHELRLRVASLWLDAETMRRAFGWDPDAARR
jgi:hypothetical protein